MCEGCSKENAREIGEVLRNLFSREAWYPSHDDWRSENMSPYFERCGLDLLGAYLHGVQRKYGQLAEKGVPGLMYTLPMFGPMNPLWQIQIIGAVRELAQRKNLC